MNSDGIPNHGSCMTSNTCIGVVFRFEFEPWPLHANAYECNVGCSKQTRRYHFVSPRASLSTTYDHILFHGDILLIVDSISLYPISLTSWWQKPLHSKGHGRMVRSFMSQGQHFIILFSDHCGPDVTILLWDKRPHWIYCTLLMFEYDKDKVSILWQCWGYKWCGVAWESWAHK